jgi:putative colanic acid biosynthesis UDP-glucose lipid carrier transferase
LSNKIRRRLSIPPNTLRDHTTAVRITLKTIDLLIIFLCLILVAAHDQGELSGSLLQNLFWDNVLVLAVAALGFLLVADLLHLYRSWRWSSIGQHILNLLSVWAMVSLFVLLVAHDERSGSNSRSDTFFYWLLLTPIVLTVWRVGLHQLVRRLRVSGVNTRKAVVLGSNADAVHLAKEMVARSGDYGIRFLGICDNNLDPEDLPDEIAEYGYVGDVARVIEMAHSRDLDVIHIALPLDREDEIRQLVDELADTTVSVQLLVPDLYAPILYGRTREFGDCRTVGIYATPFEDHLNTRLKRIEDLVLSALALPFALIPMILIALAIRVTSGSPILFKQTRYGLGGRPVEVWKFRTMHVVENDDEFTQASRNDPRVTRIGGFLRRSSLDELPQLLNVIQGRMSLVGPRPHPSRLNESYRKIIKFYMLRHSVKPGITGWAQVNGWRGETEELYKMEQRVEHDLHYIRNWSLLLDLKILIMTVVHVVQSKNAY